MTYINFNITIIPLLCIHTSAGPPEAGRAAGSPTAVAVSWSSSSVPSSQVPSWAQSPCATPCCLVDRTALHAPLLCSPGKGSLSHSCPIRLDGEEVGIPFPQTGCPYRWTLVWWEPVLLFCLPHLLLVSEADVAQSWSPHLLDKSWSLVLASLERGSARL